MFVFLPLVLPLVLPLTAWPIARLAEQRLHPRTATRLLAGPAVVKSRVVRILAEPSYAKGLVRAENAGR